jgi:hypothetical protein
MDWGWRGTEDVQIRRGKTKQQIKNIHVEKRRVILSCFPGLPPGHDPNTTRLTGRKLTGGFFTEESRAEEQEDISSRVGLNYILIPPIQKGNGIDPNNDFLETSSSCLSLSALNKTIRIHHFVVCL